jgi:hypothetical protein
MRNALIGVAKSSSTGRIGSEKMNSYAPTRNTRVMIARTFVNVCARQGKSSQVKLCKDLT